MYVIHFYRTIAMMVIVSLIVAMLPPRAAFAASPIPVCSDAYGAMAGRVEGCATMQLENGQPIAYPKLQWRPLGQVSSYVDPRKEQIEAAPETLLLANKAALALGMEAKDVVSAIQLFPSNVPMVLARYNPADKVLVIDMFKLEKALIDGKYVTGMFHATFTPSHGDFWKASGAYISPSLREFGSTAGVNPFEKFKKMSDPTRFHNISLIGAQVAVGHAQRFVRAPISALGVVSTRMEVSQSSSGNAFVKKVTTVVDGYAKPVWLLGFPSQFHSSSATLPLALMCADPAKSSCPVYEMASAGVVFEEFEGGSLYGDEDTWEILRETETGLGYLAILAISVALSFTIAGGLGAMGLSSGVGAIGSVGTVASATGVFTGMLVGSSVAITSLTLAVLVETAIIGGLLMLAGANMGSIMNFNLISIFEHKEVGSALEDPASLTDLQNRLNNHIKPLMASDFSEEKTLKGFDNTLKGHCPPGVKLDECSSINGVIQRTDQYVEQNQVDYLRDNSGKIIRKDSPSAPNRTPK